MDAAKRKRILALVNGRAADRPQGVELVIAADDHELWSQTLESIRRHGGALEASHLPLLDAAPDDHPDAIQLRAATTTLTLTEVVPGTLRKLTQLDTLTIYGRGEHRKPKPVGGLARLADLPSLRKLTLRNVDLGDGLDLAALELHELIGYDISLSSLPVVRAALVDISVGDAVTTLGAGLPATRRLRVVGGAELADLDALAAATQLEDLELGSRSTPADFGPIKAAISGGAPLRRVVVRRAPALPSLAAFAGAGELRHLELAGLDALASVGDVASLPALTYLALREAPNLVDLAPLARSSSLVTLDLRGARSVTDLRPLSSCRGLRAVALAGSGVQPGKAPPALAPYCTWADEPILDLLGRRPAHPGLGRGAA